MTEKEQFVVHALAGICANPNFISQNDLSNRNALEHVAKAAAKAAVLIGSCTQQQLKDSR